MYLSHNIIEDDKMKWVLFNASSYQSRLSILSIPKNLNRSTINFALRTVKFKHATWTIFLLEYVRISNAIPDQIYSLHETKKYTWPSSVGLDR